MQTALIGYSGFVGNNLNNQYSFSHKYNSKNIAEIEGEEFDLIVCAGIQAKKWWANQNPQEDLDGINNLLGHLKNTSAKECILISTIDVYPTPIGVTENTPIDSTNHHAYGKNRLYAEEVCSSIFAKTRITRLPGLFGEGLKKNVIYDLLNDNCLDMINPESSIPYYYLENLWKDIEVMREKDISLLNMAVPPIKSSEIITSFFPEKPVGDNMGPTATYDMQTIHAKDFGKEGNYLYTKEEVMKQIEQFISHY